MEIRLVNNNDISKWEYLSFEHDKYVKELVSDLSEWYNGNENSISFNKFMESKINKNEAFMATDENDNCLGIIAFSYKNNNITFFGISNNTNIEFIGNKLLSHILNLLDKNNSIYVNLIKSKSNWINRYKELFINNGFILYGDTIENGVPVNIYKYNIGINE